MTFYFFYNEAILRGQTNFEIRVYLEPKAVRPMESGLTNTQDQAVSVQT